MSYQVLARKWRPKTFSSLVGQAHIVRALTHALTEQRLHHAYLFTGTRGVGKTTLARILAKALNCETGITATPCGQCVACSEIDSGRFIDLLEVDAATNTRVDEMRQLLENAVYAPSRGRFKVYVIDEVHMLSNSAFNAMLKTLEEPPEHVKFILATTDPQKIPVTVLSRCLQFNLKQITPTTIAEHLQLILAQEKIHAESAALALIAHSAAGSMRDALSLLDQAIAHGAGKVESAQVRDMLGTVDLDYLFCLLDALLADDVTALLRIADDMNARSLSFDTALQALASLLTRLQIAQWAPASLADDTPERERCLSLAMQLDAEFLQLAYQIAVHGRKELPLAPDEYSGFVMTLLRLYTFRPQSASTLPANTLSQAGAPDAHKPLEHSEPASQASAAALVRAPLASYRIAALPAADAVEKLALPAIPDSSGNAANVAQKPEASCIAASDRVGAEAKPLAQTEQANAGQAAAESGAKPDESTPHTPHNAPLSPPQPHLAPHATDVQPAWPEILAALKLSGMARTLAQHCALQSLEENCVVFCLASAHRHLQMKPAQEKLAQALSAYFSRPLQLRIELLETDANTVETPAAITQRAQQQQQQQAITAIEQDPFIAAIKETLSAHLIDASIKAI
ncbi:MAG: DNA polymerase III subunit gamma/tau [Pseudomonadota bacterium]